MKIVLQPYSAGWPLEFAREKSRVLAGALPAGARVKHIGSTAVPNLAAKNVIDILIGLPNLARAQPLIPRIQALGYDYVPEFEAVLPERRFFRKTSGSVATHHLHVVETGSAFWTEHLRFRDFLRVNPETAQEYERLKRKLAEREWDSGNDYAEAKSSFIQGVLERAAGGA